MSLRSEVIRILNEVLGNSKKITELTAATLPLDGTEWAEVVQGGISKKAQVTEIGSGGGGGGTWGSITGTLSDQTDLDTALGLKQTAAQVQTIADAKVADAINNGTTTIAPSQNAVFDALALKADLASPTFTGTPTLPTGTIVTTQSPGNNTTAPASTAYVDAADALKVTESNRQQFMLVNTLRSLYNY